MQRRWQRMVAGAGAAVAIVVLTPLVGFAQIKAFPQAEGFGATAVGGRGGDVYHVTNLTDTGVGSLRYGIENAPSSGRTIVFDVGGWINLTSKLGVTRNRITIAGHTAPGGVGVRGAGFSVGGDDIVVRHMRFRPGKSSGSDNDSVNTNENAQRVIYDHISAEFSTDGGFDLQADEVTLQYSSVSYGLISHSTGGLIQAPDGGAAGKLSFHHNLFGHNETRNPKARSEIIDWRDNVIYNFHNGFIAGDSETDVNPNWRANFDGNTYISNSGGNSGSGGRPLMTGGRTQNYDLWYGTNALDRDGDSLDNPIEYSRAQAMASQTIVSGAYNWYTLPFDAPAIWQNDSPAAAYERVLAEFGATPWARDEVDSRLATDVVNRIGSRIERESHLVGISNGGFGTIGGGTVPQDTDQDGIPDAWELKHGTNPYVPNNNGDFDKDGFTDLEEYLNDLAAFKAIGPLEFSGIGRYADWKRLTNRWEPSRVDEVHVDEGAAFVDAVGQKAGTLRIGHSAGSNGLVYVTSGWLEVTEDVVLGGAGTGTLEQYGGELRVLNGDVSIDNGEYIMHGGKLRTPGLYRDANGQFELNGGILSADLVGFDLTNDGGIIAPGIGIGSTAVVGDLTLNAGGVQIELLSDLAADFLNVEGIATLGGVLDVQLLGGYVPEGGDSWEILAADSIVGSFASVTPGFEVQQFGNSLWLLVSSGAGGLADLSVPEPAGVSLLSIALFYVCLRRRGPGRLPVFSLVAWIGISTISFADTLTVIADAELRENSNDPSGINATDSGVGAGPSLNARFSNTNRNEWIALKFDLSAYTNKSFFENVALRTTMFRSNTNNTKNLRLYALTPGTNGEDWNEASITYGSMPGFTFDANSTTNIIDVGGALQNLGAFNVSGVEIEGNVALINPASLTTFVKNMGSNNLLTLLVTFESANNGQWRIASREATATETNVLTGPAGAFAPYLQFDVVSSGLRGDYNSDGLIDAADYTVWRNKLGTPGLMNEEVSPGETDIADYLYWRLRYGATDFGGAGGMQGLAPVPEPNAVATLVVAALAMALVGRQFNR